MAYTVKNYRTKKSLREAISSGVRVTVYQPGPFGPDVPDGTATLEGPHFPEPQRWYARVEVKDQTIVRLLS